MNMFISASEDENVKIWDIKQGSFELIHEKKLKIVIISYVYCRKKKKQVNIFFD